MPTGEAGEEASRGAVWFPTTTLVLKQHASFSREPERSVNRTRKRKASFLQNLAVFTTPSQSAFHHRKAFVTLIMQSLPPCLHPSRDQREAAAAGAAPALLKKTSHAAASSSSQLPG